jgi:hypothetical protein
MNLPFRNQTRERRALTGLARNPSAPLAILRKLMRVPGLASTMAIQRGRLPDDLAEALLELHDPHIFDLLDRDDRVSPAIRQRLTSDRYAAVRAARQQTIRKWIANGTRVPVHMLEQLTDRTGPAALALLAADSDPHIRRAVARSWFDAPAEIRRALLTDSDPSVREAACMWPPPAPADLWPDLIRDPRTRLWVVSYVSLAPELAAELACDPNQDVRSELAKNPCLPPAILEGLVAAQDPMIWANLIRNRITPESVRAQLYPKLEKAIGQADPSAEAIVASMALMYEDVSWPGGLPLQERLSYLDSPYAVFRRSLARHRDLPAEAIARLERDPDPMVRQIIARRADAQGDFLERVVRECGEHPKYRPFLVEHPNFPQAAFVRFAEEPEPRLRALACRNPSLRAEVVARLARDKSARVRASITGHPNFTSEDALRLLGDDDLDVVEAAAASPALPLDAMEELVKLAKA